jgi:hypothetical protein
MEKEDNSKSGSEYAIGILETIQILLNSQSEDLLRCNLEHIKKIIPVAIKELKQEFNQHE